ncbi:MAG TPA: sodium:solute symporter family protein [Longimicrobiales bacterium]
MRELTALDWLIVVGYLALALAAAILVSRRASRSIESYFVADRDLPWWWLGTSMVATTFAADTPLVVTGMVAAHGIAGNWFWWSWAVSHVSTAVVFAALWRRSGVLTDAELVELRYAGRSAMLLRGFKAIFFAVLINGIVLGWVFRAMSKIAQPFVHWDAWLGADRFAALDAAWPDWLLFGTLGDTLTVLALFAMVVLYSTMGGIRGVILTDLIQFAIAMVGSIVFAVYAVGAVGGVDGLMAGLVEHYGDPSQILALVPGADAAWLPVQVFLIYLAVQWWAQYFSDGSGYIAQRLFTAKSDAHAEGGGLWFCVANYGLRTWPWILIGLVSLVLFPLGAEGGGGAAGATGVAGAAGADALAGVAGVAGAGASGADAAAAMVAGDREMAYPVLMALLLPAGVLGLLFASLLAAFMSTVDTHINWASSYLVNDLYRRFVRPAASQRELVAASRVAVVAISLLAIVIASHIGSVEKAWKFFVALGAGLGLPAILRWLWWRVNAWTEIAGMTVATVAAPVLYTVFPDTRDEYLLVAIVALATAASLVATFVTPPEPREHLARFFERVRPPGWWGGLGGAASRRAAARIALGWVAGNVAVFGLMFGVGYLILGRPWLGTAVTAAGGIAVWLTLAATRAARVALGIAEATPGPEPDGRVVVDTS